MSILEQLSRAPFLVPLSVDQYHRMIAQGILGEGDSIELIDGLLLRKDRADRGGDPMSHGPRHAGGVKRLQRHFRQVEEMGFHLHSQLPVTLGDVQEPEPDLALVRGREEDYSEHHPKAKDIAALLEVADSSLQFDRTTKQRLYARAEIPVYGIVNLVENHVEVYQDPLPAEEKYASRTDYLPGQTVTLILEPGREIRVAVSDLLP